MSKELADLLMPNVKYNVEYYENLYKPRNLNEGEVIVRFAPSPTGFIHMGSLYTALINRIVADTKGGKFLLRIEDTDQKRQVENGVGQIVEAFNDYGLKIDEGMIGENEEIGEYGLYKQSERKEIYEAYVKWFIEIGKAYPCFCTEQDLNDIREEQTKLKCRTGYYRSFAKCRSLTFEEIKAKVEAGEPYIIRFKSNGNYEKKIKYKDIVRGQIEFPENDQDIIILKSDGLPTYHFAHIIDDHLMQTTHVIRSEEWISSVPLHLQLFAEAGFKAPKYAHVSAVMKEENGNKRKLSKRKDPEAASSYYVEQGIPVLAVKEYLYNIINSNFEDWRRQNPDKNLSEFPFSFNKMSASGALFDHVKLIDICKNVISRMSAKEVYDLGLEWAKVYDKDLAQLMEKYSEFTINLLNIERTGKKIRKDIAKWSDLRETLEYMYDEVFYEKYLEYGYQNITDKKDIENILNKYIEIYDENDDKDTWFNKMKEMAGELGYAKEVKAYKENPDMYKGHIGDVSMVIRVALTTKQNTPDLYELLKNLGKGKIQKRFDKAIASL